MNNYAVIITGPTASGKTAAALNTALKNEGEIINADSLQIYRYLDIGTAKPSIKEQKLVKHHLIDIKNPDEEYSAYEWRDAAQKIIIKLNKKNKLPVICGGTFFYIKSLIDGLFEGPSRDDKLRDEITNEFKGDKNKMYDYLKKVDQKAAEKIHPNNAVRTLRAIEVYRKSGRKFSELKSERKKFDFNYIIFCLDIPRAELYERINQRAVKMFDEGLIDEVKEILKKGYSPSLKPLNALGYKHSIDFLRNKTTLKEAVRLTQRDTRRYAKRQKSFLRQNKEIIYANAGKEILKQTGEFLKKVC